MVVIAVVALYDTPAIIFPAVAFSGLKINLLPGSFSDIAEIQIPGQDIEAKPPGVSEPVTPDFRSRLGVVDKRVVGWNGVWRIAIHIDP